MSDLPSDPIDDPPGDPPPLPDPPPPPDPVEESNELIAECRALQDELNTKLVRLASLGVVCGSVSDPTNGKSNRVRLTFTFQDAP